MAKIRVGITGQAGFIGTHLFNELGLFPELFERISFEDDFFYQPETFLKFLRKCDVIIHLAAVNRHKDPQELFRLNISLVKMLLRTAEENNCLPHILFASSIQEKLDNVYGKSKREGHTLLRQWAEKNRSSFTGIVIPNVFGPFARPNYNSFVATFCYKLVHNEKPEILTDSDVPLVYVSSLCKYIISDIKDVNASKEIVIKDLPIPPDFTAKVSEVLSCLIQFKDKYFDLGTIPELKDVNELLLFNTFRSYININRYFPVALKLNTDARGSFVETIRLGVGGQVSFSTTLPGISRGNHYHTRKIERFTVIKGKARIQLRKIGSADIYEYYLDGTAPSYVDMPVWYTHNITNIGDEELYTQFWINEWYDESDPDTYFETV